MPRGGRRAGKIGKPYGQRSDLNKTAPSKQYGQRAEQERSLAAVPVAPPPAPPVSGSPPALAGGAGPQLAPIDRPTDRPNEPLTHGLSSGPGLGPEALNGLQSANDADLKTLAPYLPTLELLASQPGATIATRNLIRRIRGGAIQEAVQKDLGAPWGS